MASELLEQPEADRLATDRCTCDEARTAREMDEARERMKAITTGKECVDNGFIELAPDELGVIDTALENVVRIAVHSFQITLRCGDVIEIKHGAGGVKMQRKKSVKREV